MNIEKLTVQNFRNFEGPKTFQLNPHFTAFIGVNGKGKSTILHALRIEQPVHSSFIFRMSRRDIFGETRLGT
jgi:chromosome segregation ATPase